MRFAVVTGNRDLFNKICLCFPADTQCTCYDAEPALLADPDHPHFSAILLDASTENSAIDAARREWGLHQLQHPAGHTVPLILFGVQDTPEQLEQAFATGADDVVLGPLDCAELYIRTQLAVVRAENGPRAAWPDTLDYEGYRLDRPSHSVHLQGQTVVLTAREFALTWLLFSRPGDYVSRTQLAEAIWGSTEEIVGRSIEQHIYKLRKKLHLNGETGVYLRTMYAHGYRIESQAIDGA